MLSGVLRYSMLLKIMRSTQFHPFDSKSIKHFDPGLENLVMLSFFAPEGEENE